MARIIAVQLGLFAFGVTVCAGLLAGNSFVTVVSRALVAMVVVALFGYLAGWAGKTVLRDHLSKRKLKIDQEHHEKRRVSEADAEPLQSTATSE